MNLRVLPVTALCELVRGGIGASPSDVSLRRHADAALDDLVGRYSKFMSTVGLLDDSPELRTWLGSQDVTGTPTTVNLARVAHGILRARHEGLFESTEPIYEEAPPEPERCVKCGSDDLGVSWHGVGFYHETRNHGASCFGGTGARNELPEAEHLHHVCRSCRYEWTTIPKDQR